MSVDERALRGRREVDWGGEGVDVIVTTVVLSLAVAGLTFAPSGIAGMRTKLRAAG